MKNCSNCKYSDFGKTNCFRLMDYANPKIDISKGVECGEKYIHWLGEIKKFSDLKVGDSFYMWYDGEFYEGVILSIRKTEHHIELYTKFKKENCENFYTSYHYIPEVDKEIYITCITEESQEIVSTSMDRLLLECE